MGHQLLIINPLQCRTYNYTCLHMLQSKHDYVPTLTSTIDNINTLMLFHVLVIDFIPSYNYLLSVNDHFWE